MDAAIGRQALEDLEPAARDGQRRAAVDLGAMSIACRALGAEVARPHAADLEQPDAVRPQLGEVALEHHAVAGDLGLAERGELSIELDLIAGDRLTGAADAARQLDAHIAARQQPAARRARIVERERREAGQHDVLNAIGERGLPAARRRRTGVKSGWVIAFVATNGNGTTPPYRSSSARMPSACARSSESSVSFGTA
jgi:hypothetical protein